MAGARVIRLYVISVEDRCPRCLRRVPRTAIPPDGAELDRVVCPHCEAILDVCDVPITASEDDEEGGE